MSTILGDRIRIQVELALASDAASAKARALQECSARAVGLSGAEIDAARARRCFDRRAHAAVILACAVRATAAPLGAALIAALRDKARRAGLSVAEIEAVTALARPPRAPG